MRENPNLIIKEDNNSDLDKALVNKMQIIWRSIKSSEQRQNSFNTVKHERKETSNDPEELSFCTEGATNINNYVIGKRIGQGAYAVVRIG